MVDHFVSLTCQRWSDQRGAALHEKQKTVAVRKAFDAQDIHQYHCDQSVIYTDRKAIDCSRRDKASIGLQEWKKENRKAANRSEQTVQIGSFDPRLVTNVTNDDLKRETVLCYSF